jgi:hypothetical protein
LSPVVTSRSQLTWMFVDDEGRSWHGIGSVTPSPDEKAKFIVTLKLAEHQVKVKDNLTSRRVSKLLHSWAIFNAR